MRSAALLLAAAALFRLPAQAQPPEAYKIEFTIHDAADASAKSVRRFAILVDTRGSGSFKLGNREPVASAAFQPATGANPLPPLTQYTYLDTGVNIDCHLEPVDNSDKLFLRSDLELSYVLPQKASGPNPAIGQFKLKIVALLSAGKRTVVASIDDPATNRKLEVEALVSKAE